MKKTKSLLIAGLAVASVVIAATSMAGSSNIGQTDYLTLNRAAALPGVVLPRGSYVFEAVEGHPDVVRVSDRATRRVLYMDFVELIPRPRGVTTALSLGEAAAGEPIPINAWFPTGSATGRAFKHR